jgi:hypothetical protein
VSDYRCPICHVNVIGDAAAASCLIEGDTYTHFQCYIADLRARLAAAEKERDEGFALARTRLAEVYDREKERDEAKRILVATVNATDGACTKHVSLGFLAGLPEEVAAIKRERDAAIARAERAERERDEAVESKDVAWKRLDTATKGGIDYWTWRCRHLEADRDRLRAAIKEACDELMQEGHDEGPGDDDCGACRIHGILSRALAAAEGDQGEGAES